MTLSMSGPPSPWHRMLPAPAALLSSAAIDPFPRRSSSLLQHHFVPDQPFDGKPNGDVNGRSTCPVVSRNLSTQGIAATHELPADARVSSPSVKISSETLMRKRNASVMAEEHPSASASSSPTSTTAPEIPSQFCLCQPDPKIPRPRNAFILYRQHHQAAVVAQNPGLPNPDISKIIGEQWRNLPVEAKAEWKALAEEEKARHQQQYPDYRYQPRRNGRYSSQSSISGPSSGGTVGPKGICLKCGGKIMNPPSTPYTAYAPVTPGVPRPMVGFDVLQRGHPLTAPQTHRPGQHYIGSPPHSARQRPYTDYNQAQLSRHSPRLRYHGTQPPPTTPMADGHDSKRRRYNGNGVYVPSREMYSEPAYHYFLHGTTFPRNDLPPNMQGPRSAMPPPARDMYPPPQPHPQLQLVRPPHLQHKRDPTLTLPPLKTSAPQSAPTAGMQTQKSGMEAMIMSIPVLNKIKILSQIAPHLAAPGITSPQPEIRGAILAVEGMDPTSVYSMTNSLAEQLEKDGKFAVRIFGGPNPYPPFVNAERMDCVRRSGSIPANNLTTEGCLNIISKWHKISREMVEYITTKPGGEIDLDAMNIDTADSPPARHNSVVMLDAQASPSKTVTQERDKTPERGVRVDTKISTSTFPISSPVDALNSAVSPKTITKTADLSLTTPPIAASSTPNRAPFTTTLTTYFSNPLNLPSAASSTRIPAAAFLQQAQAQTQHPIAPIPPAPAPPTTPHRTQTPLPKHTQSLPRPSVNAIPIALVAHYQLTTVDASSIAVPITDAYSPLAHWQWLATLWRGCIGPDVTVVIKGSCDDETPTVAAATVTSGNDPGGKGSTATGGNGGNGNGVQPGVEVRLLDYRTVVVRTNVKEGGDAASSIVGGENWEKAKRRVGFEVAEFLTR